jgi:apolipoprotein N-acyltransferase
MSLGETAFPWVHLGYTQTYYLYLIQYADITAVYGVSFWIVCINIVFFLWYLKRIKSVKAIGVLFVFFLFPFLYSLSAQQKYDKHQEKIKIALIQGNIDPFEKWNQQNNLRQLAVYDSLTKAAMHQHPDLIIWPETATPYSLRKEYQYLEIVRHIVKSTNRPLITGSIDFEYVDNKLNYYNAVLLLEPGTNTIQKYAKMKLVPFSEKVPYSRYFLIGIFKDFLYDLEMGVGDYARGTRYNLFSFKKQNHIKSKTDSLVTFTTQICYESVFPNHIRKFVLKDADFISIITNDAWFGKTTAPFQHKQIAVFRAIENRRAIARCANTGISCFIDPFGRVGKQTGVFKQAKIVDHISLEKTKTFYTVHGNVFVKLCAGILILTLIILIINKGTYHFSKS